MLRIARLGEVTPAQLAQELGQEETEIKNMLRELVEKGYLREEKTMRLPQSIWESLEKKI